MDLVSRNPEFNIPKFRRSKDDRDGVWNDLDSQRREGLFCDVTLQCRDGQVTAHKCILMPMTPYFKALFASPLSSASTTNTIVLDDYSVDVVTCLLDSIYGDVEVPAVHLVELLRLAEYVQFDWLVDMLVEEIRNHIDKKNVFDWCNVANSYGIAKLKFLCDCFIRENHAMLQAITKGVINVDPDSGIWNKDCEREVVVLPVNEKDGKRLYMIDLQTDKCVECFHPGLLSLWDDKNIKLTFVFNNIFYVLTQKAAGRDNAIMTIWRYQHTSKTFDFRLSTAYHWILSEVRSTFSQSISELSSVYYSKGSIFVEYNGRRKDHTVVEKFLLKFNMTTGLFYDGYVIHENKTRYDELTMFFSLSEDTYFVCLDRVYNLTYFDFCNTDIHTEEEWK